jgi:hypothetical protein
MHARFARALLTLTAAAGATQAAAPPVPLNVDTHLSTGSSHTHNVDTHGSSGRFQNLDTHVSTAATATKNLDTHILDKTVDTHLASGSLPALPANLDTHIAGAPLQYVDTHNPTGTCSPDGLCLSVTAGPADPADPLACATTSSFSAEVGDPISWCYTLTNNSSQTLDWHSISDSLHGSVLAQRSQSLAPGQTFRYVLAERAGAIGSGPLAATWTASASAPGYNLDDSLPPGFVDISDGEALQTGGGFNNARSAPVQMPFAFQFYGRATDRLCVGRNGAIEVGSSNCAVPQSYFIPSGYLDAVIAPLWSGFRVSEGTLYTKTLGTPGQRRFVIEWKDFANEWPYLAGFTFQAVIEEGSNAIEFHYQSTGDGQGGSGDAGSGGVSGLQASKTSGTMYSQLAPVLPAGKTLRWTPLTQAGLSASAGVDYDIGAAQLLLPIPSLQSTAASGMVITQPIVIGNTGNRTLSWNLGEFPPAARPAPLPALRGGTRADAGRDPQPRRLPVSSPRPAALGDWLVPGYAMYADPTGGVDYVSLDVTDTSRRYVVLPDNGQQGLSDFSGGDFAGEDFGTQYMIDTRMDRLYRLDTLTGALGLIGWPIAANGPGTEYWSGAAWDPRGNTFYAVTTVSNGANGCYWSGLYTISLVDAAATYIGPINPQGDECVIDIAVDNNGQMFGLDLKHDALLSIDKHSGASTTIGALGVDANFAQSIKFDRSTGVLYWLGYVQQVGFVATIDPLTAQPTVLGPTPDNNEMAVLAIARAGGDCNQPLDANWLRLTTASGSIAPGDPVGVYPLEFDATQLAPGDYAATLCLFNNDPRYRTRPATVPVTFHVVAGDLIFQAGFEQ